MATSVKSWKHVSSWVCRHWSRWDVVKRSKATGRGRAASDKTLTNSKKLQAFKPPRLSEFSRTKTRILKFKCSILKCHFSFLRPLLGWKNTKTFTLHLKKLHNFTGQAQNINLIWLISDSVHEWGWIYVVAWLDGMS